MPQDSAPAIGEFRAEVLVGRATAAAIGAVVVLCPGNRDQLAMGRDLFAPAARRSGDSSSGCVVALTAFEIVVEEQEGYLGRAKRVGRWRPIEIESADHQAHVAAAHVAQAALIGGDHLAQREPGRCVRQRTEAGFFGHPRLELVAPAGRPLGHSKLRPRRARWDGQKAPIGRSADKAATAFRPASGSIGSLRACRGGQPLLGRLWNRALSGSVSISSCGLLAAVSRSSAK